ncbi:SDR family oxidoreductase [Microbacterium pseudoresistens]|uniref:NAD(P)-dependent dehydrogenase (Short-subunit alcohol dehydrogenase family) n=1 Tax=Microbacterium pseudoresistens TaxID=640634 RepID=A0A7Y9EV47_9MICO|nr:SDR family oxidoreductase [Microbacterium pseudoresistens]NYD54401.1 NAD(P)-dependent dehydrogenase (short-subunit alcohol dehydrogenase family) [Microbacterium pseudoresistens]
MKRARAHEGRTYVVTGGASGIGRATVRRLLDDGAIVFALDIDEKGLDTLVVDTPSAHLRTHTIDTTSQSQWHDCVDFIRNSAPTIDGCVLNVGRNMPGSLTELSAKAWRDALRLTLDSNVLGFQALHPLFGAPTSVVFTTSIHAALAFRTFPAYAAGKGALTALARQLAVDYAPQVRVNALAPGAVRTAIWDRRDEAFQRAVAGRVPLGRIADPEEIASVVAFLLSSDSSYITGQTITVDGGRSIDSGE